MVEEGGDVSGGDVSGDGVTEELTATLALVQSIRVISRTSVTAGKGSPKNLTAIAKELGVDLVIEGSVPTSGDRPKITAQLIRMAPERHIMAQCWEGGDSDISKLQGDASKAIVEDGDRAFAPLLDRADWKEMMGKLGIAPWSGRPARACASAFGGPILALVKDEILPQPLPQTLSLTAKKKRRVCIVGGGGTGAALAYDLALRGIEVILLEKGELTSGTTGRHHGQLHSGARYAWADRTIARECYEETLILRRIVPEAIEYNGGFFIALSDDEADLAPEFIAACMEAGIPARETPAARALELEPGMNPALKRAVWIPDGSFDAFRLPLAFFAASRRFGAVVRPWCEVMGFEVQAGRVVAARILDRGADPFREDRIEADYFVSATGAWAGKLAALAGLDVPITAAPGTMVAVRGRFVDRVVSRLRRPSDGDIVVPQRGLSIIGSTQRATDNPEALVPPPQDIRRLIADATALVPAFGTAAVQASWAAARPLAGRSGADEGRSISRDFAVLDHAQRDGVAGIATIIGGKATVLRAMAEKTADAVCAHLGVMAECETARYALPSWRECYAGGRP